MKVAEFLSIFNQMLASDRVNLLCKLLQSSLTYELNFLSIVLHGYLKERLKLMTDLQGDANTLSYYTTNFVGVKLVSKGQLETLSACLSLIRHDNHQVGDVIYELLNQPDILNMAEEIEDLTVFENLRLVYILAVYHPSLCFTKRHRLLTTFLHQLDEIHNSKLAEIKAEEIIQEEEAAYEQQSRPVRPAESAHIVRCELIGFYKRQTDRRYAYVIEVEWSDGAVANVHRTYGDFFGFQNKLLDLFPEESGQKNKKSRVIPFLPGRRLLSGKSNRELAEKRLPDLFNYTRELFRLPSHISSCKHVQDFFRPLLSDHKDISTLHKLTMLSDIKESSSKSRHPSAPAGVTLVATPASNSPKSRSGFLLNSLSSSRNAQTLPPEKSPGPQREIKVNKHATMPNQSAFVPVSSTTTPSSSTERLQSSSQTSLGSIDRLLITPATTACHIVTPPTSRKVSPAFTVSTSPGSLTSTSWSGLTSSAVINGDSNTKVSQKVNKVSTDSKVITEQSTSTTTLLPISIATVATTTNDVTTTSSWAECSPPATTDTSFYFSAHDSSGHSSTTTQSNSVFRPIQSTSTTKRNQKIALSPSLSQLQQYGGGGGSQPSYAYPVSYTPTRFDSPSPSPKHGGMGGRWQSSYGPLCTTPTTSTQTPTESDQLRKWLKVHRLHKYEHLFKDMTFSDMSELSVEQLKDMGMTLGAAKKLYQKMEELKQTNISSFCSIPHTSLTRKPSTASLPAALLLQDHLGGGGMTPSTSIDQLSLNGSSSSLNILGGHTNPTHVEGVVPPGDHIISKVDGAIVEAGPVNGMPRDELGKGGSRKIQTSVVRSKSSHGNFNNSNSYEGHAPSRSMENTPSHSPLKLQRSLSPHRTSQYCSPTHHGSTSQVDHHHYRHLSDNKSSSPNRSSLPNPQQLFSTPQFHRKDIHSLPPSVGGDTGLMHHHHHHPPPPKIQSALLPNRLPNWPIPAPAVLHGATIPAVPHSTPVICGRVSIQTPPGTGYPASINGVIQTVPPPLHHVGQHQRVAGYPINVHHSGGAGHSVSCYNCGKSGHHGSSCPMKTSTEESSRLTPNSSHTSPTKGNAT